jgi:secondary thiamine-phosphate synthase enzyme
MVDNETIKISTQGICDLQDITDEVQGIVQVLNIKNGLVCVLVKHTTAAVLINEFEPHLEQDIKDMIEKLVPQDTVTRHDTERSDDNGWSHLRACLFSPSVTVPLKNAKLVLGTWQKIILADFDSRPRQREIIVQVAGE